MTQARVWAIAFAGSVALHILGTVAILPALQPRPMPQQSFGASRIALATLAVQERIAQQREPQTKAAKRSEAEGTRVAQGVVRIGRASPAALAQTSIEAVSGDARPLFAVASAGASERARDAGGAMLGTETLPELTVAAWELESKVTGGIRVAGPKAPLSVIKGEPVAATSAPFEGPIVTAAAPKPVVVSGLKTVGVSATAEPMPAQIVAESIPAFSLAETMAAEKGGDDAVPSLAVDGPILDGTRPMPVEASVLDAIGPAAVSGVIPSVAVLALAERAPPAPEPKIEGTAKVAVLAWSGSEVMSLDPQGVATLAAFLQPGSTGARELRDRMSKIMAAPPCSRIQTVFDPASGALEVRGHVPEQGARAPLLAALRMQIGDSLPLKDSLRILPEPQCGFLEGIAELGLPQSEEQFTDRDLLGENAHVREYSFVDGDRLRIALNAPDYPAYVYVDYFDAAGQVIHLVPNAAAGLRLHAPGEAFEIGGEGGLDLRIAAPFGQDIAVAFASSVPLYDDLRPLVEPALPYLQDMRRMVAEKRTIEPEFRGEWVYLFVATRPKDP